MDFTSSSNARRCGQLFEGLAALAAVLALAAPGIAQALPEAPEKAIVQTVCTACHNTDRIVNSNRSAEEWQAVVRQMIRNGAELKEDQVAPVIAYLAKSFPPLPAAAGPPPRTSDGKPDLSGVWTARPRGVRAMEGIDALMTTWGKAQYLWNTEPIIHTGYYEPIERQRIELDPVFHCYPAGPMRLGPPLDGGGMGGGSTFEIVHTPGLVTMIFETRNQLRYVYLDMQEHPKPLELSWNGHSISRWEGDTLVIDTIGLRDETWFSSDGQEHSTQLHMVERIRRPDAATMEIERTYTDPVALTAPYVDKVTLRLNPNFTLDEHRNSNECSQYMVRKPAFGKGMNGLLGISEHPGIGGSQ